MTEPANETRLAAAAMPLGQFVYTLLYGGMTVLAGVLAFKQVQLWPTDLAVESGIFAFLLLVVISSTMAQLLPLLHFHRSRRPSRIRYRLSPLPISHNRLSTLYPPH